MTLRELTDVQFIHQRSVRNTRPRMLETDLVVMHPRPAFGYWYRKHLAVYYWTWLSATTAIKSLSAEYNFHLCLICANFTVRLVISATRMPRWLLSERKIWMVLPVVISYLLSAVPLAMCDLLRVRLNRYGLCFETSRRPLLTMSESPP